MSDLFLGISPDTVDWSRAQFALTAMYHWLFVPLTLGLALIMGIMETIWYKTRKPFWRDTAKFWQKLFGINFAMGVATGIILEFEFGTNWSNYSWLVGDIFGAPLAVEAIVAFFLESTFVGVMFFGWQKVSRGFHLASTWLTGIGATLSAWWILVANAWMQYPVGQAFNPDTMRNEMTSFLEVALSPFAIDKFFHTVISAWIVGAVFAIGVSCYYLLKKRETQFAVQSIKVASVVGIVASLLTLHTGDSSAYKVAQVQPMKLAAMEALYNGGNGVGLTAVAAVNPFSQPDYANEQEPPLHISMPKGLSFLATRTLDGYVPGVNDIIKGGYTRPDGQVEPSLNEKIQRGQQAVTALKAYRSAVKQGDKQAAAQNRKVIDNDMKYFGYATVTDASQIVPFIPLCFWSFRVMVGLGALFVLFFIVSVFIVYKKDITKHRWLHIAGLAMIPLAYIASEAGWVVAEMGRQPWTIQDMLPTWTAASDVTSASVMLTFFIFLIMFTLLLCVEVNIMCKAIRKGPEFEKVDEGNPEILNS